MTSACHARLSASSRRRAPLAWAIADDTPPPMPALAIVVISTITGTTSDAAAIACKPSELTK
jgi:hypothetical protein